MCGIAGIINFNGDPVSENLIKKMTDVMEHRGPDDEGRYIKHHVGLGHRRLSIIDLSPKGHQPMCNEDGSVWIVFNGEIYNYKLLNKVLQDRGHHIRSNCDTETIIHLYEEFGTDCVHHLRGMFSFAIWDEKKQRLFAAVDRMRIKPFYYYKTDQALVFSSELKAIQASGFHDGAIDFESIHHYLSLQAIPVPYTIYKDIFTLPGGWCLEANGQETSVYKYWDISYEVNDGYDEAYYVRHLRDLIAESVEMRLMSDVPLGAFLSGGIDSSVIVGLMKDMKQGPVKTFSIGYDVGGRNYDDTYYANLVAKRFGTDHTVKVVTAEDILEKLKSFIWYLDQPSTDAINSYFVSELAAKDVTVVLCGQGGDELFAGYRTFDLMLRFLERDKKWEKLPPTIRRLITNFYSIFPEKLKSIPKAQSFDRFLNSYGSFVKKYGNIRLELNEIEKKELYTDFFRSKLNGADSYSVYSQYFNELDEGIDPINKISYLDFKVHLGDVLMRDVDVMSMAFSLETRIPLIDHKLVEFVSTIPPELKLKDGKKKYIFLEAMKHLLPEEVLNRPKLGFAFPLSIWLRKDLKSLVDFVLSPEITAKRGFFNQRKLDQLKEDFYKGKNLNYRKIWGVVVLELWMRLVLEEDHEFFERLKSHVKIK